MKPAYGLLKNILLYYLLILLSQYELDLQACIRSARNSDGAKKRERKLECYGLMLALGSATCNLGVCLGCLENVLIIYVKRLLQMLESQS